MRILGIDPGLQVCGYAVLDKNLPAVAGQGAEKLLEAGLVRTDSSSSIALRLNQIAKDFQALLKKFRPGLVAVEELYSHYAHPRTAILMGHARGVILQTAAAAEVEVRSFSATRIKKAITGNGKAPKMQVQKAIKSLLGLQKLPAPADVADAIAAALCCANEL
jgi:crossover junction endodeoxyribonuclease RuvC